MCRIRLYRVRYLRASSPEMPRISWLMVAESNATDRVESLKVLLFHGLHGNSPCNFAMLPIALETESRVVDAVEVDI